MISFSEDKTIFDEIYKRMKKDFELVNMGNWDKSWIKLNILELRKEYIKDVFSIKGLAKDHLANKDFNKYMQNKKGGDGVHSSQN